MRTVAIAALVACGGGDDPLIPAAQPAAGHVERHDFRSKQAFLIEDAKYGAKIYFFEESVEGACEVHQMFDDTPRYYFSISLGKVDIAAGLELTQLGREPDGPGKDGWIGRRGAGYTSPNRDWDGKRPIASLGYGGGSYHLSIEGAKADSITGRIAIGRFNFDEASLSGTFAAVRCPKR